MLHLDASPVMSMAPVVELIEVVVEIASVVLTEYKMLLAVELDEAASAGKTNYKLAFEYA